MSNELGPVPSDPELNDVAAALGSLAPSRGRLDRDRVMFRAGRASVRPASRGWMAAAAALAALASGEAALLVRRPSPLVVERIVVVREPSEALPAPSPYFPRPSPPASPFEIGPGIHDRLAWQVLRYGLDGLPASAAPGGGASESRHVPPRELLRRELRQVLEPGGPS